MPEYAYEALTSSGTVARGAMVAEDERELEDRLRGLGQYLIQAREREERRRAPRVTDGSIRRKDLLAFTEYLSGSIQAGIPILATLSDVERYLESKRLRRIVAEAREAMAEQGKSLSEALSEHPKAFSQLYVGTIEAGEATGHLDFALQQLVEYLDWQQQVSSQMRQATMYPALVFFAISTLVLLLVTFVYPRLLPVISGFDIELPLPTRIIMTVALFLRANGPQVVGGIAAAAAGLWLFRRTPRGRLLLDRLTLHLPIFGALLRQIHMARFVTYTALFYRTGVELVRGLTLVERMIANRVVADAVRRAREAIVSGETMAQAFGESRLFPPIVLRSIALGEATGNLDEALGRAKGYYDREVPAAVRRLLTALQPLLVVLLGAVIVVVALSIFLPILTIYQSIGR